MNCAVYVVSIRSCMLHRPLDSISSWYYQRQRPFLCLARGRKTQLSTMLKKEIKFLLQKQAICQIPTLTEGVYSNTFIGPKKDGGQSQSFSEEKWMDGQSKPETYLFHGPTILAPIYIFLHDRVKGISIHLNCHSFELCTAPRAFLYKDPQPPVEILRSSWSFTWSTCCWWQAPSRS